MPIANIIPNYVRYNDKILELIKSYPGLETQEREKIKSCLTAIWEPIPKGATFNSDEMFNKHKPILKKVKIQKAILDIINQSSSVNNDNINEIIATNIETQQTELIINIKNMVLFMNRIINILETKALFFSKETQTESFFFLKQVFFQIDAGLDIISSDLYNNKIKDYNFYIEIQNVLLDQAVQLIGRTQNIIKTSDLRFEDRTSLKNLILHAKEWHLCEAKCFFALGQDKKAYEALAKITPNLDKLFLDNLAKEKTNLFTKIQDLTNSVSANLNQKKTKIISEIENNVTRKTYIEIINALNEKDLAPSENKNEVSLAEKNSLNSTFKQITNEKLNSILKEFEEKILNSKPPHEKLTLEVVQSLRFIRDHEKTSLDNLELCSNLYQKLIGFTILDPEYKPLKDKIIKDLVSQYSYLQNRIKFSNMINAGKSLYSYLSNKQPVPVSEKEDAVAQTPAIEKVEEQETSATITIENVDNSKEKESKKEARRLAKKAKRKARKKETTADQQEKKTAEQLPSKTDSTKALQIAKALEEKAKKQEELEKQKELKKQASEERSRKQKEQALLTKQKLEDEAKKQAEKALEERAKKKAEKKAERQKKKEAEAKNQSDKLKQKQEEATGSPLALEKAITPAFAQKAPIKVIPDLPKQKSLEKSITTPVKALTCEKISESEKELKEKQSQTNSAEDLQEKINHLEALLKQAQEDRDRVQKDNDEARKANQYNYNTAEQLDKLLRQSQTFINYTQKGNKLNYRFAQQKSFEAFCLQKISEQNAYTAAYWQQRYIESVTASSAFFRSLTGTKAGKKKKSKDSSAPDPTAVNQEETKKEKPKI